MKLHFVKLAGMLLFMLGSVFASSAQIVIKVRPAAPVVRVRPAIPGPRHVWVNGDYAWRGGQYYYTDGYWAVPPPRRSHWVEGKWKHRRGGWVWIPGHWR